ncbi:MAG: hypothetical protein GX471_01050 [Candidatus Microthrix parvicella]|jgi:hypothetical protein|nr:hypothetical protein [Candidatus Microthrix parvicella]
MAPAKTVAIVAAVNRFSTEVRWPGWGDRVRYPNGGRVRRTDEPDQLAKLLATRRIAGGQAGQPAAEHPDDDADDDQRDGGGQVVAIGDGQPVVPIAATTTTESTRITAAALVCDPRNGMVAAEVAAGRATART